MVDNETYACPIMTEKRIKICILSVGPLRYTVIFRLACESFLLTPFVFSLFAYLLQIKTFEHETIETP